MVETLSNFASTVTASAMTNAVTTVTLSNAGFFPASGNFRLRIDDELMLVGTRTGNVLSSITRGIEGTTAASHATGAAARHVLTAASVHQVITDHVGFSGTDPLYGIVLGGIDETLAVQRLINAAKTAPGGIGHLPPGNPRITSALSIDASDVWIKGAGAGVTEIHLDNATATGILVNGGVGGISNVRLSDLTLSCFKNTAGVFTRSAGKGLHMVNVGDYVLENIVVNHGWEAIYLDNVNTGIVRNVKAADGAVALGGQSTCFFLANSIGNRFEYCQAASVTATGVTGWDLNGGIDTLTMEHCSVQGVTQFAYGMRFRDTVGAGFGPRWVRANDCYLEVDDVAGFGVQLAAGYDIEFNGLYTKGGKTGVHIVNAAARYIRFKGGIIQLAQEHGMLVDDCDGLDFDGTLFTDNGQKTSNTYDGIIVAPGSENFSFRGVRAGDLLWNGTGGFLHRQRHGIHIVAGVNTTYVIEGCDLRNNLSANLNDGGTGHKRINNSGSGMVGEFSGTGTPEGAITAGIGSRYYRADGGAGTTFYVKESGTGNTGWIAK